MTWTELWQWHMKFNAVNDEEEQNLERLETAWWKIAREEAAEEAEKETSDVGLSPGVVEAEKDFVADEDSTPGSTGLERPEALTFGDPLKRRGRARKKKAFPDFVNFDDDGGLSV